MARYNAILVLTAIFAIVLGSTLTSVASADNENGSISYANMAKTYVQGLKENICGNHICASGEFPHSPIPVVPAGGH